MSYISQKHYTVMHVLTASYRRVRFYVLIVENTDTNSQSFSALMVVIPYANHLRNSTITFASSIGSI